MTQSIDWDYWRKLPEIKVFEAIALLHGTEPESEPPEDASPEYRKVLRLLSACLSDRSIFTPGVRSLGDPALHRVTLIEVGAWAKQYGYTLPVNYPQPTAAPPVTTQAPTETKEQRQDRRLAACEAAGLVMPKSAEGRLPDGVGGVADREGVTRQAFSPDVKAAIQRRINAKKEGSKVHRG